MTGTAITVKVNDEEVKALLQQIAHRLGHLKPAMSVIGEIVRTSVVRNFEEGGRPRWKRSKRAEATGGKTLMKQGFAGGLAGSINYRAQDGRVTIGTNKVYAAVHQFGAKKGSFGTVNARVNEFTRKARSGKASRVRAHTRKMSLPWGNIPARPYMMVQREDWSEMVSALRDYVMATRKA